MAEEKDLQKAKSVYKTLCEALDERKWHYDKHPDDLVVTFSVSGEDIPMKFVVKIDAERDLVRMISPMPLEFGEDKRVEGAIATCQINYSLADGSFDYDFSDGSVVFRLTSSYKDSLISKELFSYMVSIACFTVDEYNDKLLMLAKGKVNIEDFFDKE